ncbi:hypothetical protein Ancab_015079 [Ancistrocladus abbreviatus]
MEALSSPSSPFLLKTREFLPMQCHSKRNIQCCRSLSPKVEGLGMTHQVFDEMPRRDTFPWNQLIGTHLSSGELDQVVVVYEEMLMRGVRPDKHTLPRVLAASRLSNSLVFGKQIHGHAVKLGHSSEDYVITALMEMYGHLDDASTVKWLFDKSNAQKNPVSWTLLMDRYIREQKPSLAIKLFYQMVHLGAEVDAVAVMTAVGACAMLRSLQEGRKVHQITSASGLESDVLVSNSLLKMYINCDGVKDAREAFDRMLLRDAISWTEMVRGYVRKGGFNEGIKLFRKMVLEGIRPDATAISSILPACARMTARKQGKEIHGYLIRNQIEMNVTLQNALMDMYVKSGFIECASKTFAGMMNKDAISWTIMMHGYSLHGQGARAVELFHEMQNGHATEVDQVLYASALHACVTANIVEEGRVYFSHIRAPEVRHFALMVSLLARAGHFTEARAFIEEKQIAGHAEVQRALLVGCRAHRDLKIGKQVIEQLCNLDPLDAGNYIMLSNWFARSAKWDMVDRLRETIRDMGLSPKKAYSWTEFRNKVHVFATGDLSHPRSERIYWELQCLIKRLEEGGYCPDTDFSLHDVDEERECVPLRHSEMLAISFGLITTKSATIRVTKNLNICRNCHGMAKAISKVVEREIIVKDPNCFHHFKDGYCSCGDFW